MGDWLKVNGEAIYGCDGTPWGTEFGAYGQVDGKRKFIASPAVWRATTKPGKIYLHVLQWPKDGRLDLPALTPRITAARLLATPAASVRFEQAADRTTLLLPSAATDPIASVIRLDL